MKCIIIIIPIMINTNDNNLCFIIKWFNTIILNKSCNSFLC